MVVETKRQRSFGSDGSDSPSGGQGLGSLTGMGAKSLADLKGKRVCQVSGSSSWKNLTDGTNKLKQKVEGPVIDQYRRSKGYRKNMQKQSDDLAAQAAMAAGEAEPT